MKYDIFVNQLFHQMFHKISLFLLLLLPLASYATHLRSGEISYRPVPGFPNTYEITVTLYTNASSTSDQPSVELNFGDGSSATVLRCNGPLDINKLFMGDSLSPTIKKNFYTIKHFYTVGGNIVISISEKYRNVGILNIPNGDNNFYVESMLTINNALTPMSSPVLSLPPIGDGCNNANAIYKINPGAIDPDGDLLRFKLEKCKNASGNDISGYQYPDELDPSGRSSFTMNPKNGIIIWDKPITQGEYNISFKIEKWRNGVLIGYVLRDMQVTIAPCDNIPPVIDPVPDFCVEAGTTLNYHVTSHDANNDSLTFTTTGTPYEVPVSPAKYTTEGTNIGSTSGTFNWDINTIHYSKNPYMVYYKVTDSHNGSELTDVASNFITIIAPSVKNVNATVYQKSFNITWDKTVCTEATGYNIYRKTGTSTTTFDQCNLGVPPTSGYALIGTINDPSILLINDSNKGTGFTSGITYCYIVTAFFADGAETAVSEPGCSALMIPLISVIQDTLYSCQLTTLTIDSTIVKFENTDQFTSYSWITSPEIQLTNANKPVVDAKLMTPGLYSLRLVATSGLYVDSAKIFIRINSIPVPKITLTEIVSIPGTVMFYNKSTDIDKSEWLFPNGTRSTSNDSVSYVFDNNGTYRIYLTVFNQSGCSDTTSILYSVALWGVAMPNAFEPDNPNSELNMFRPAARGLQTYYLGIWDMWGNLIWDSVRLKDTRPDGGWDGNDRKGRKMPAQNYIWRMKATYIDGTVWKGIKDHFGNLHLEGTFNLLR